MRSRARPCAPPQRFAGTLAVLAGPDQQDWAQEWPAHLALVEHSWRRPFEILYYTAGFAVAATKWRARARLQRPTAAVGAAIDKVLGSGVLSSLGVLASVVSTTWLTDIHSGPAAASVVLVSTTAGSLTALNQARQARGIEKKRRKRGSDAR